MPLTAARLTEASGSFDLEAGASRVLESYGAVAPTIYSDAFNRANGALGTPWVTVEGALAITSNACAAPGGAGPHTSLYNQTFSADQWADGDAAGFGPGGTATCPAVRINGTDLYYAWMGNNVNTVEITKRVSGSYTTISANAPCTPTSKVRLEAQGTTIRCYVNGTLALTATDSSIATGQPGILGNAGGTLDNWRGGALPFVSLYSDDFNRSDTAQASGALGVGWTSDGWHITSNQAVRTGGSGQDFATFVQNLSSADHWAETRRNSGNYGVVNCRHPSGTDWQNCYMGFWSPGSNSWVIGKAVGGGYSDVSFGTASGTPAAGTVQRLEVQGSVQRLYADNVLVATGGDTSITSGNYAGMNADGCIFDDFRCGLLPWTP